MNRTTLLAALAACLLAPPFARSAEPERTPGIEVYGFAKVDYIQDFKRVNPAWNASMRPTRIPTTAGQYGGDGEAILNVRQSRLGVVGTTPGGRYPITTRIEVDFYGNGSGVAPDSSGQHTIHLRRAYGEWGPVLGGFTDSLFMDDPWWPNIIEYFGPCGMAAARNVQLRYTFLTGVHTAAVALERPATDLYTNYDISPPDLAPDNKVPDLTVQYRQARPWGWVQLSGLLRRLGWARPSLPKSGAALGWGINASSVVMLVPDKLRLLVDVAGGQGIANYMTDATTDLAASGSASAPTGEAVPLVGVAAYVDVYWTPLLTSALGYSAVKLWTTNLQAGDAFARGQYASANLLVHLPNVLAGPELLWGRRDDKSGASGVDYRLQISLRFSFSSLDFSKGG